MIDPDSENLAPGEQDRVAVDDLCYELEFFTIFSLSTSTS